MMSYTMAWTSSCSIGGRLIRRTSPWTRIIGGRPADMWRSDALFLTAKARSSVMSIYNPGCDPRTPVAPVCRTGPWKHANRVPMRRTARRPRSIMFHYEKPWQDVRSRIARAAHAAGRDPDAVRLLAVSKTFPAEAVRAVHALGQREFGENYVQEGAGEDGRSRRSRRHRVAPHRTLAKQQGRRRRIASPGCKRSTGRRSRAGCRPRGRPAAPPLDVCIEVKASGEASKSGVAPDEAVALGRWSRACPGLRLRGIMGIPEPTADAALRRAQFRVLRECFDACRAAGLARGHAVDGNVGRPRGRDRRGRHAGAGRHRDLRRAGRRGAA